MREKNGKRVRESSTIAAVAVRGEQPPVKVMTGDSISACKGHKQQMQPL